VPPRQGAGAEKRCQAQRLSGDRAESGLELGHYLLCAQPLEVLWIDTNKA